MSRGRWSGLTLLERIERRTTKGECWVWNGGTVGKGYGYIWAGSAYTETMLLVHRASWELHFGLIPSGMNVLHHCDNPPCWRPEHLWLGTLADNNADMDRKGRANRIGALPGTGTKQFCLRGHDTNTIGRKKDGICRECGRAAERKRYHESKSASSAQA